MGLLSDVWDTVTDIGHAVTGIPTAEDRRNAKNAIRDQVDAMRRQTEIAEEQLRAMKDQKDAEKRRMNEKQVRSLRRTYGAGGFLDQPISVDSTPLSTKLGG